MADATTSLNYLSLEQLATEFPTKGNPTNDPTWAMRRLVAIGAFGNDAVRVGEDGPWRVSRAAAERFLSVGCPNLQPPATNGGQFDDRALDAVAGKFTSAVIESAWKNQVARFNPKRDLKLRHGELNPDFDLDITAEIISIMRAPTLDKKPALNEFEAAEAAAGRTPAIKPEWSSWPNQATAYLVSEARRFVWDAAQLLDPARIGGMSFLYRDPSTFSKVVEATIEVMQNRGRIIASRSYPATMDGKPEILQVYFRIGDGAIMKQMGVTPAAIGKLAF